MTTMTTHTCSPGEWTEAHVAGADGNVTIQGLDAMTAVRVRIGATAADTDGMDDPHMIIQPLDIRTFAVKNGDTVLVGLHRRVGTDDASTVKIVVWA